ncbi:FG-GAP-like repeat-containing protein [Catellatospora bangladeshensis]
MDFSDPHPAASPAAERSCHGPQRPPCPAHPAGFRTGRHRHHRHRPGRRSGGTPVQGPVPLRSAVDLQPPLGRGPPGPGLRTRRRRRHQRHARARLRRGHRLPLLTAQRGRRLHRHRARRRLEDVLLPPQRVLGAQRRARGAGPGHRPDRQHGQLVRPAHPLRAAAQRGGAGHRHQRAVARAVPGLVQPEVPGQRQLWQRALLPPAGSPTDFSGDGKDDIVTFNLGSLNDVYVATSTGTAFAGTSIKWNDFFGLSGEKLLTGDFNGDGKDDIITFVGGTTGTNAGDVYVGLSTGTGFLGGAKWHDWFAPGAEVPAVGDVNGDGRDDIITFTHDTQGDVYVALSTGTGFGAGVKWHEYFSIPGEHPAVGDVNGDGRDDIITFTQGPATAADVIVALSTGAGFGASQKWHDLFAVGAEQPRVGDVNGDGKDDIVTFTCNADADVYAAVSNGSSFVGTTVKWNDFFCLAGEFPYLGDYNGDGKDDIIVFSKGTTNDVYVGLSTGTGFLGGAKWHDFFGLNGEVTY